MARKRLLLVLYVLLTVTLWGQRYPVTAVVTTQPPLMPTLDYFISEHLQVILLLNDAQAGSVSTRLRLTIEGNGVRLQTSPDFIPAPLELTYGVPLQLTGLDLQDYLDPAHLLIQGVTLNDYQQAGKLPEGFYSVCVEVYDYRRQETPISNQGCAFPYLQELEPPLLTAPPEELVATEPQQIVFSWLPQHLGAFPVTYTLYVYEWTAGLSLDQVWAYQAPLTVESMTTSYLWGPAEVPLDTGKTYVARVRIEDLNGEAVFKNNGYSTERIFRLRSSPVFQEPCTAPENFTAQVSGDTAWLSWTGTADTFHLDYWEDIPESSKQWYRTRESTAVIPYLEPGKTYRLTLRGFCGTQWLDGADTLMVTIPLPRDTQVACGEEVPVFENQDPLPRLLPGDVVLAGGVPIEIVTAAGGNGTFSGTGAFRLRYAPTIRLGVDFNGIKVNTAYQLIEGHMQTQYDPSWSNIPSVNLDFSRKPRELAYRELNVPEDVDSVWVDEDGKVWIVDNSGQQRVVTETAGTADEPPIPLLIIDIHGDVWRIIDGVVLEEGQKGVQSVQQSGNTNDDGEEVLTGASDALVTFQEDPEQAFGFDAFHVEKLAPYYENLEGHYYVAYKSVAGARQDGVVASLTNTGGIAPDSIVFESALGSRWPPVTWTQQSTRLPVLGKGDTYEEALYALLKNGNEYKSIGKLNTVSYEPVHHRVILVSVGESQQVDAPGIQDYLNEVYRQAVASWSVEVDNTVLAVDWDPEGDGLYIDRGVVDKYHSELDKVIRAYQQDRGIDEDAYYAFLIPRMQDPSIQGFMPRGGPFAFIAAGSDIAHTMAHELGHGAFTLEHIFADDASLEGQTDNLMDYSTGHHLMKHQWDRVHDPKTVWGLFEGEEEGKQLSEKTLDYQCITPEFSVFLVESNINYYDLNGEPISIKGLGTPFGFVGQREGVQYQGALALISSNGNILGPKVKFEKDSSGGYDAIYSGTFIGFQQPISIEVPSQEVGNHHKILFDQNGTVRIGEKLYPNAAAGCPFTYSNDSKTEIPKSFISWSDIYLILIEGLEGKHDKEDDIWELIHYFENLTKGKRVGFVYEYLDKSQLIDIRPGQELYAFFKAIKNDNILSLQAFNDVFQIYTYTSEADLFYHELDILISNIDLWEGISIGYNQLSYDFTTFQLEDFNDYFTCRELLLLAIELCTYQKDNSEYPNLYSNSSILEGITTELENLNEDPQGYPIKISTRQKILSILASLGAYEHYRYTLDDLIKRRNLSPEQLRFVKSQESAGRAQPITAAGYYQQQVAKYDSDFTLFLGLEYFEMLSDLVELNVAMDIGQEVLRNISRNFRSFEFKARFTSTIEKSRVLASIRSKVGEEVPWQQFINDFGDNLDKLKWFDENVGRVKAWHAAINLPDEIRLNSDDIEIISNYIIRSGKSTNDLVIEIPTDLLGARRWLDNLPSKTFNKIDFNEWLANIETRPPSGAEGNIKRNYQIQVAGDREYNILNEKNRIWADGLITDEGIVIEAKHITDPNNSPFVAGSSSPPPFIRQKIIDEVKDEFRRYADIINDPNIPLIELHVYVNRIEGKEFFENLLSEFKIPGRVLIVP